MCLRNCEKHKKYLILNNYSILNTSHNRCKRLNKLRNATSKKKLMKKKDPERKSVSLPDLTSSVKPRLNGVPRTYRPELDKM